MGLKSNLESILNSWNLPIIFVVCLCLVEWTFSAYIEDLIFCYDSTDPNCPSPSSWGGHCNDGGIRQSPIALPTSYTPSHIARGIDLHINKYRGNSFKMINNGHTVVVQLPKDSSASPAPITLGRNVGSEYSEYRFDSAHFHWGPDDNAGSEHCLENRCFAMEMHLVHYRSDFDSVKSAVKSADPNTVVVIGIMLEVPEDAGDGNKYLAPIVQNLGKVVNPSDEWMDVNTPLDFTHFLSTLAATSNHFTYKGSLTTPNCNQKVNWYVFDKTVSISHNDVNGFRNLINGRGKPMKKNHRPLQNRNNRAVYYAAIKQV